MSPMSKASRLRLLRSIAEIDWSKYKDYLLLTLTYPDEVVTDDYRAHTRQRSVFLRDMERLMDKQVPVLWRKEWQSRKSGHDAGKLHPHWHMVLFDTRFVEHGEVKRLWTQAIGARGFVSVNIKQCTSGEHAARYAAKYCGKPVDSCLDNGAYLNMVWGRPWGLCRSNLIPRCPERIIGDLTPAEVKLLKERGARLWKGVNADNEDGFTIFAENANSLADMIIWKRLSTELADG